MKKRIYIFIYTIALAAISLLPAYGSCLNKEYYTILNFDCMKTTDAENHHRDYGTVSYVKDGVEMLENGIREETARQQAGDSLHNIYAKDYFTTFSTNYSSLSDDDIILKTNAFWNPVKAKIRYVNYIAQPNAKPRQEWIDHFDKVLTEEYGQTDSPVIISEAWITWWNGVEYAAVNATNCIGFTEEYMAEYENSELKGSLPYGTNNIMYKEAAVFVNNVPVKQLNHDEIWEISDEYIPQKTYAVFTKSDECEWYGTRYFCLQYDKNHIIQKFPVYESSIDEDFDFFPTYFFGDIDGDSRLELVEYERSDNSSMFGGYTVYDLEAESIIYSHFTNDGM